MAREAKDSATLTKLDQRQASRDAFPAFLKKKKAAKGGKAKGKGKVPPAFLKGGK